MIIFPAIDIVGGKAVRLFKGNYSQMTVYSDDPAAVAADFVKCGADHLQLVDLEGAKDGGTPNLETVKRIREACDMFIEIGGGIRSLQTIEKYLSIGVDRVILGTAAVKDEELLRSSVGKYGEKIAVGVDIKDGFVAIKGWLEKSEFTGMEFCKKMQETGVSNIICTDVSKDGAMKGTNLPLYREMTEKLSVKITASGGVSSLQNIKELKAMDIYGAIIGKAYYTGAIDLREALEAAK